MSLLSHWIFRKQHQDVGAHAALFASVHTDAAPAAVAFAMLSFV